jgi:16S rRNA (uracil1498-N3)-methyltransferase
MHRFFIPPDLLAADTVALPQDVAHQVRDVLRLRAGDRIVLLDNRGQEFVTDLRVVDRAAVRGFVVARRAGAAEPGVALVLYQGLLKAAKFEWILQKGTELGVQTFVPMRCQRTVAGLEEIGPTRIQRWQRILQEAAEQCGRAVIPDLAVPCALPTALADQPPGTLRLFPWEEATATTLRAALAAPRHNSAPITRVALFVGPEGGFTAAEAQLAAQHGARVVTLGRRILRAETAALAATTMVLYEFAELG